MGSVRNDYSKRGRETKSIWAKNRFKVFKRRMHWASINLFSLIFSAFYVVPIRATKVSHSPAQWCSITASHGHVTMSHWSPPSPLQPPSSPSCSPLGCSRSPAHKSLRAARDLARQCGLLVWMLETVGDRQPGACALCMCDCMCAHDSVYVWLYVCARFSLYVWYGKWRRTSGHEASRKGAIDFKTLLYCIFKQLSLKTFTHESWLRLLSFNFVFVSVGGRLVRKQHVYLDRRPIATLDEPS